MKHVNPDLIRLQDILQAMDDIEDFKPSDLNDKKTLHAVLYNIAIIGEAINKISAYLRNDNPKIPWAAIINIAPPNST